MATRPFRLGAQELEQRLTPAGGNPDPTFHGTGSYVITDRSPGTFQDVLVDAANRAVAVGNSNGDILLARFRPDGTPDPRFGTNGFVSVDFAGKSDAARGVVVRTDGSLWVSGTVTGADGLTRVALLDVAVDGTVRGTFTRDIGADGAGDVAGKLAENPSTGDLYIAARATRAGGSDTDNALVRFSKNGAFLNEWRSTGVAGGAGVDVAIAPDTGRVYLAGRGNNFFSLYRFESDLSGRIQRTVSPPPNEFTGPAAVEINPNTNQVYFVGTSASGHTFVRADLGLTTATQQLFSTGTNDVLTDVAIDNAGRLVTVGFTTNVSNVNGPFNFMISRMSASGTFDATFGTAGKRIYNIGANDVAQGGVALSPDGRIVVAGYTGTGGVNTPVVARVLPDDTVPPAPPPNTPPAVTAPGTVTVTAGGGPVGPLAVGLTDDSTPANYIQLTATSDNTVLFPPGSIVVTNTGTGQTLTLTPAPGQTGTAVITLTAVDQDGATATQTFQVTVVPNTAPTVTAIADQTLAAGQSLAAVPFTVGDAETPAGQLVVTAASSDPTLIDGTTIVLGGGGPDRTLTLTPVPGRDGTATITVTVADPNGGTAAVTFLVTVLPNQAPTVAPIADRTVSVPGSSTGPIAVTVGDAETAAAELVVTATSGNPALVPATGVALGGAGPDRTVTVTPAPGQTGTAVITVTVRDAGGLTATQTFTVTVTAGPGNTAPTVSAIADRTVAPGLSTDAVPFTVGDAETAAAELIVTATSDNPALVPAGNIVLAGGGADRTVAVAPATGQSGTAVITVTVRDAGGLTASESFTLTVTATPDGPGPALVGWPEFAAGTDVGRGTAALYNPNGTRRFEAEPFPGFTGGVRTAAADFNGDGVADLVAGTGPGRATRVVILDGVTRAELFAVNPFEASFTGGVYVAAGDLTGDGVPDLVITPDEGGGPRVDAYSGAGFGKVMSFFGIDDTAFRGGARAATGDITGDGRADLIVVAGFGGGPRVAGFDGNTVGGTPRRVFGDFFAFEQALRNGIFVAAGDVDGDGFADLIAGGGPGGGPRVTVFGGKALLNNEYDVRANFFAGDTASRGGIRVAAKDLDGDASADLVVGAGTGAGSRVTAYYGKDLAAGANPEAFAFDAFGGFAGGVFVG